MNLRIERERRFHDAEAANRAMTFAQEPRRLRIKNAEYLDHALWIRPAFDLLGDVAGKRLLDFGCGHGMAAVVLARRGAMVAACDLSEGYIAEARQRSLANESLIQFTVADGHVLPFADASFDLIWGHAILHHLEIEAAAQEIRRVMAPGGRAVFCEPWAGNPAVNLLRRWRRHTDDERVLNRQSIHTLRQIFGSVDLRTFQWSRYSVITARR